MPTPPIDKIEGCHGWPEASDANLPSILTTSELHNAYHKAVMEIAIWLSFDWITKEALLKSGPNRDLESGLMVWCPIHSVRFLWSLFTILEIGLSPTNLDLPKLENRLVSVVLYKEITKQNFGPPEVSNLPDRFLIWGFPLAKITPKTGPEQWECTDQSVLQVSAVGRLCTEQSLRRQRFWWVGRSKWIRNTLSEFRSFKKDYVVNEFLERETIWFYFSQHFFKTW